MTDEREKLSRAWLSGYCAGLQAYAWWRDGVQYVGSCVVTLEQAVEQAKREYSANNGQYHDLDARDYP